MGYTTLALSAEEIRSQMKQLENWVVKDSALERSYRSKHYMDGLERLNAIAQLSEAENHHPELILEWGNLTIRYWTHTANGITALDFQMARKVEAILSSSQTSN